MLEAKKDISEVLGNPNIDYNLEKKLKEFVLAQTHDLGIGIVGQVLNPIKYSAKSQAILLFDKWGGDMLLEHAEHKSLYEMIDSFIKNPDTLKIEQGRLGASFFTMDPHKDSEDWYEIRGRVVNSPDKDIWMLGMGTMGTQYYICLERAAVGRLYGMLRTIHMGQDVVLGKESY